MYTYVYTCADAYVYTSLLYNACVGDLCICTYIRRFEPYVRM